jgi:hypothetical protein
MFFKSILAGLAVLTLVAMPTTSYGAKRTGTRQLTFKNDPTPLQATLGQTTTINLPDLLVPPVSGSIVWSSDPDTTPAFVKISGQTMTIKPGPNDSGMKTFRLNAQSGENGATTIVNLTVVGPPVWSQPNIDLGIQNEDSAMTPFDLKRFVTNPAGGAVTFTSNNLEPWMSLSSDGIITGTPKRPNVKAYSGIIITATGAGGSSTATAFGKVLKTIKPPSWTGNPIKLGDAKEDSLYSLNVYQYVNDYEKSAFTYAKVSGPDWITVSPDGNVFGTPGKNNLGGVSLTVSFTTNILDGVGTNQTFTKATVFTFNVVHVNHPPKWKANPLALPGGATKVNYSQDLSLSASDPDDNDKLTFTMTGNPAWAKLSTAGVLSGTPDVAGTVSFQATVTDSAGASDTTTVTFNVVKTKEPPTWIKPVVLKDAKEDGSYAADLNGFVKNPDGLPLTFTLLSGPAWATVSSTGFVSGTPKAGDIGLNKFSVKVANEVGSDIADVLVTVIHTNHAPFWVLNPIRITVKEKEAMSVSIAPYAKDPDTTDTLTFQLLDGQPWATLSSVGTITGMPPKTAEGDNTFHARVADNGGLSADVTVIITVLHVNEAPYWTMNPINLPDATEDASYKVSIADYAKDPDTGDVLTFSKVSGPDWITVGSDGTVSGTPRRANVGPQSFVARVMDQANAFADVTVNINVIKINHPPRWRQDPILMVDGYENKAYAFDLTPYAVDDDGDALTFTLVAGPDWMKVNSAGMVSGLPPLKSAGPFTATFQVADPSNATAQAGGKGNIIHVNQPPVVGNIPTIVVNERQVFSVSLLKWVTDPDEGTKLNFVGLDSVEWIKLSATGDLTMSPKHADIGDHTYNFKVDDGELFATGTVRITVNRDPRAPVWKQDPIRMEAKTNVPFTGTLDGQAIDLDGYPITYKFTDGKPWLSVAMNGGLSGTPLDADLGEETFTVSACNDVLCTPAKLIITVKPGITTDVVQIDKPVPGAPANNVWVIDTSNSCSKLMKSLRDNVHYYFDALKAQQIHHTGLYLSSDAHKWDGLPIHKDSQDVVMKWSLENPAYDFQDRMSFAEAGDPTVCGNCFSSPIWSMFRQYQRAPQADYFHNGMYDAGAPMDVMVITQQRDHYKAFTPGKPQANWTPNEFAKNFIDFHTQQKQSYRISVVAPAAPNLVTENPNSAAPDNAYQALVSATKGTYYAIDDCNVDIKPKMEDYAKKVIFRAFVNANNHIKLSKTPKDVSTITVSLGGITLQGNTGAATDLWSYDAASNTVTIFWYMIDQSGLKPGQQMSIQYRVS